MDIHTLYKDVARYVEVINTPAQARHVVDRALRIATAERTVCCIIVPNDVQELDAVTSPPRTHGEVYSGVGLAIARPLPSDAELQRAAGILNEGKRVAILVGAGALDASKEVRAGRCWRQRRQGNKQVTNLPAARIPTRKERHDR